MKIGRCEFTFDADGKGGSTWWQKALLVLAIPFLLVYLLLDALLEAPDRLLMGLCNILGRAGIPEIGGGLLQLRYPMRRIAWFPEGMPPEKIALLERHGATIPAWARRPHFECVRRIPIRRTTKKEGRE
jgi:hypothetical protein